MLALSAKILFFLLCVLCFWTIGPQPRVLLGIVCAATGIALWRWHSRLEIIRMAIAVSVMTVVEIAVTSQGTYTYASPQLVSIPLWLPIGWGFFSLTLFRIVRDLGRMTGIRTEAPLPPSTLATVFEIVSLPLLIGASHALWSQSLVSNLAMLVVVATICVFMRSRAILLVVAVSIVLAVILEYGGIAGGVWWWNAPDLAGLPLWVPLSYAYLNVLFYRLALRLEGRFTMPVKER